MKKNNKQNNKYSEEEIVEAEKNRRKQKLIFVALIFFGVVSLFLAVYQIKYSLRSPFLTSTDPDEGNKEAAKADEDVFLLQGVDTDKDGLSDYDEKYVYNTSPYLEDTDSDGFTDKREIDTNNNPNCASGNLCNVNLGGAIASSTDIYEEIFDEENNDIDVNALRSALLSEGVPKDVLDQISDEELLTEFLSITGTADNSGKGESVDSVNKEELKNLTPQEIRELLKGKGIDESVLNSIDDETLKKDYLETLNGM